MLPHNSEKVNEGGMPPEFSDSAWYRMKPADAAGIRILVVEDDGMIAFHTADLLEKAGFSVLMPVASGEEALEYLEKPLSPDLFLIDIQLAGRIDGIETARQIMEQAGTPVIFMSAWSDNPRIIRATLTKPYAYLVKPVNDRELLATIATTLYRHSIDRKLAESEERYHAVVDNAAEGILLLTYGTHEPVEANPAFRRLIGYGEEEILPDIGEILAGPGGADAAPDPRQVLFQGGRQHDVRLKQKDGSYRMVDISSSIISRKGKPAFLAVLTYDVTDRKRAEAALSEANRKLNLLSEVTRHDILNQLTKVRGWLEIAKDSLNETEKLSGFLSKAIQGADAIGSLITFTRDYQNMGVAAPVWQNVAGIISAAPPASRGNIAVIADLPEAVEVYADTLFPKVIYNLIDNTVRHGGDAVTTLRFSVQENHTGLTLAAEDNGTGIAPEEKEKIFERGYGKNTGLGLFLSREILGITGFAITETGEPGTGARFEIAIPKGMYRLPPAHAQPEGKDPT